MIKNYKTEIQSLRKENENYKENLLISSDKNERNEFENQHLKRQLNSLKEDINDKLK